MLDVYHVSEKEKKIQWIPARMKFLKFRNLQTYLIVDNSMLLLNMWNKISKCY